MIRRRDRYKLLVMGAETLLRCLSYEGQGFSQDCSSGLGSAIRMWFESVGILCNLVVTCSIFDFRSSFFDFSALSTKAISVTKRFAFFGYTSDGFLFSGF